MYGMKFIVLTVTYSISKPTSRKGVVVDDCPGVMSTLGQHYIRLRNARTVGSRFVVSTILTVVTLCAYFP